MNKQTIRYCTSIVRAALEGRPPTSQISPFEALARLEHQAMAPGRQAPPPKGHLPDHLRDPELLAVLRPGVADLLTKIVTRRLPASGQPATGIAFVEWLIRRHNFRARIDRDGNALADAADLAEEISELHRSDTTQSADIARLQAALLAIEEAATGARSPAEAVVAIGRLTQAALHPEAADPAA